MTHVRQKERLGLILALGIFLGLQKIALCALKKPIGSGDEGPGFHASVLRQRGEPFVTTKKNGTGLGLYVSELFAQSLAGHLEVKNKASHGAVVSMCWPIKEDRQ